MLKQEVKQRSETRTKDQMRNTSMWSRELHTKYKNQPDDRSLIQPSLISVLVWWVFCIVEGFFGSLQQNHAVALLQMCTLSH